MEIEIALPPGVTTRGATLADLPLVADLVRAADEFDQGEPGVSFEDIEADWRRPGFDPAHDVVLAFDGDRLIGEAEVPGPRVEACVHPEARGRGIGTALLLWTEQRALQRAPAGGEVRVGQTIVERNVAAIGLLRRHGYETRHTSWVLRLPDDAPLDTETPPEVAIRPFEPERETSAVYRVIEDAFNEWPDRTPTSFAEWQATTIARSDFDPSLLFVAVEGDEVVGAALALDYPEEGWVQQVAVRRDRRSRGVGRALLSAAFGELRRRGSSPLGLSTDSRTGALDLYLRLGMQVHLTYSHYSKLLRGAEPVAED